MFTDVKLTSSSIILCTNLLAEYNRYVVYKCPSAPSIFAVDEVIAKYASLSSTFTDGCSIADVDFINLLLFTSLLYTGSAAEKSGSEEPSSKNLLNLVYHTVSAGISKLILPMFSILLPSSPFTSCSTLEASVKSAVCPTWYFVKLCTLPVSALFHGWVLIVIIFVPYKMDSFKIFLIYKNLFKLDHILLLCINSIWRRI